MNGPFQLSNILTNKSPKSHHNCTQKRPCRRLGCIGCLNTRKWYWRKQFEATFEMFEFDTHLVISFLNYKDDVYSGLHFLTKVYKPLSRLLALGGKFICIKSVTQNTNVGYYFVPHFHIITNSNFLETRIRKLLKKHYDGGIRLHFKQIQMTEADRGRIIGYLIDQNLYPTSAFSQDKQKLVTSSQGIRLGWPQAKFLYPERELMREYANELL